MAEVKVNLGDASYKVIIETAMLDKLGTLMQGTISVGKVLLVTDTNVGDLYGDRVEQALAQAGFGVKQYRVQAGEDSKAIEICMELYTKAIEQGLDRKSAVIALGGGVVGDLTGFVAATFLRGVPFVQIPTSLLAQVDSSVGGKVAVNHPLGKNLIGAFYQPKVVYIDTELLNTLPARELYTGLAEVIKYGVIADSEFFTYLATNCEAILAKQPQALAHIAYRSCSIKANVVEQDEKESSLRAILNFGHTIAHAIETNTGYNTYTHGEAVAIGMHGAALVSKYMGLCKPEAVERLCRLISQFRLPLTAPECRPEDLLPIIGRDKKAVGGKVTWVLMKEIGQVELVSNVPEDLLYQVIKEITR